MLFWHAPDFGENLPFNLRESMFWLVQRGSHAYGTNIEGSDRDFQGICIPPKEVAQSLFHRFDQYEYKFPEIQVEATIFALDRFFKLASQCNPNVIEALFVDTQRSILFSRAPANILLENRDLFLSNRIGYTFSGYAISQLKRIKGHKNWLLNPVLTKPERSDFGLPPMPVISSDLRGAAWRTIDYHLHSLAPYLVHQEKEQVELFWESLANLLALDLTVSEINSHTVTQITELYGYSSDFVKMLRQEKAYENAMTEYNNYQTWLANRNKKRFELESAFGYDVKHGMHLVRLLRMGKECLLTGELNVWRPDRAELIEIRKGAWSYDQLIAYAESEQQTIQDILKNRKSVLPNKVNESKIEELYFKLLG